MNKEIAAKYNALKNTTYAWVRNKNKILPSLEEGKNVKRQKLRGEVHKTLDQVVLSSF